MKTKTYVVWFLALGAGVPSALFVFLVGYAALAKYGWITSDTAKRVAASIKAEQEPPEASGPELEKAEDKVSISATCRNVGAAIWDVTLKNNSRTTSFRNIRYRSIYEAESGTRLRTNRGAFMIVLRPGETRKISNFNDGILPQQSMRCGMVVYGSAAGAEAASAE